MEGLGLKTPPFGCTTDTSGHCVTDNDFLSKLCFNETLAIVNEKEEELGELIGKIRASNTNTSSPSMTINLQSKSISDYGEETGTSVITNTATSFKSYEEKWSQWSVD